MEDGSLRLWSITWRDGRPELHESVKLAGLDDTSGTVVGFSPRQPILASGGADGHVILWNISNGAKITTLAEAP
jgi:WD40 repeat protein